MSTNDPWTTPLNWNEPNPAAGSGTNRGAAVAHDDSAWAQQPDPAWSQTAQYPAPYPADYPGYDQPPQPPYGPPPQAPRSPSSVPPLWGRRVAAAVILIAVAVGSGVTGALVAGDGGTKTVITSSAPAAVGGSSAPTEDFAKVAAAVMPSVVSITVQTNNGGDTGSGVILRSDGTIVTNNHVVADAADGAGTISVKFSDGSTAAAQIMGRDPATDLAVIKATGVSGKTPATLGTTSTLHVGDAVLAIGSPLGLEGSVSSGIVSALHRTVALGSESSGGSGASVGDAIQTDAAINPGNSGGPLVDDQGRVIGINSAIASLGGNGSAQSGSIGVGFAIPVDEVKSVSDQLIKGQTPKHALLGVNISDDPKGGALITDVTSGSAAAKAGLQTGDVVTKVDQSTIDDGTGLSAVIRSHQPGDKVTVQYTRNGSEHTAVVTLGSATG
ncbi:MAG: HtrA2 peptidase [Mycobacterium sp.]|nr:HtrA2 peptidase [Mycobacterium sp.]